MTLEGQERKCYPLVWQNWQQLVHLLDQKMQESEVADEKHWSFFNLIKSQNWRFSLTSVLVTPGEFN